MKKTKKPQRQSQVLRLGQESVEYTVLFGAIILITLTLIVMMSSKSGASGDFKTSLAKSYWGSTSPWAINDYALTTDGVLTVEMTNTGGRPIRLDEVQVAGVIGSGSNGTTIRLEGGRSIERRLQMNAPCPNNSYYELDVNFTFSDADSKMPAQRFIGKEPLIGHCNGVSDTVPDCGGLLCIGQACSNPNDCQSHHCHDTGGGKICVECIGNGHCSGGESCIDFICQ